MRQDETKWMRKAICEMEWNNVTTWNAYCIYLRQAQRETSVWEKRKTLNFAMEERMRYVAAKEAIRRLTARLDSVPAVRLPAGQEKSILGGYPAQKQAS